jgi:xanthine phosphoribosyltransferase
MNKYYYNYEEFILDVKELTKKIDWKFDTIVGVARGGLTLSHILGEYYNIRDVYSINTIGYDDDSKLDSITIFNIPNLQDSTNVLIVDDIVDSGDTLKLVLDTLSIKYPKCTFKSVSIFYKKTAILKPNWYLKDAKEWIDFFWSVDCLKID